MALGIGLVGVLLAGCGSPLGDETDSVATADAEAQTPAAPTRDETEGGADGGHVRVLVINATATDGVAGRVEQVLERREYEVDVDSRDEMADTVVHYRNGRREEAEQLVDLIPEAALGENSSLNGVDLKLVLGRDFERSVTAPATFASWTGGGDAWPNCHEDFFDERGALNTPHVGLGLKPPGEILPLAVSQQFCLIGFDSGSPVDLTIELPGGRVLGHTVVPGSDSDLPPLGTDPMSVDGMTLRGYWSGDTGSTGYFQLDPSLDTGEYTIEARQGRAEAKSNYQFVDYSNDWGPLYLEAEKTAASTTFLIAGLRPGLTSVGIYAETDKQVVNELGEGYEFDYVGPASGLIDVGSRGYVYLEVPSDVLADGNCLAVAQEFESRDCSRNYGTGRYGD